jgi:hypothetical protein
MGFIYISPENLAISCGLQCTISLCGAQEMEALARESYRKSFKPITAVFAHAHYNQCYQG